MGGGSPPYRPRGLGAVPLGLVALLLAVPPMSAALSSHAPPAPVASAVPIRQAGPAGPRPASTATFDWGLAYIIYGLGDDTTHFMGEGAAMVVDDHLRNVTVFGGEGSGGLTNWTVNYNATTGSFFLTVPTPSPSARTNVSFAAVPGADIAVLFGGLTDLGSRRTANDTWVYSFATQSWRNVTHGRAPPPREGAAFAVNASSSTALLEGGFTPSYTVNGSSASVLWNDTWSLNLTTFNWTALHPANAPAPAYAAGMIWEGATDRYELFGGCGLSCSSTVWSFAGSPANWLNESTTASPSGRAAAAWVWDSRDQLAILFGGFDWNGAAPIPLGDGYLYSPLTRGWSALSAGGGPGPRFGAPNAWADFPGCVGLNLLGGNVALAAPPGNASVLEPLGAPQPNCFPDLLSGGGGPPPPPCSSGQVPLSVYVFDNFTGRAVANASVNIDGGCVHRTVGTDSHGYANLSIPAPDKLNVTASASGYRSNELTRLFLPNSTNAILLPLGPLPGLRLRSYARGASGIPEPLAGVAVYQGTTLLLGRTDARGYLNATNLYAPGGRFVLFGSLANYSTASAALTLPYSGAVFANLTLLPAGGLDIHVVDAASGAPLLATGVLRSLDPGAGAPALFRTDGDGWYNLSNAVAANLTVSASAVGYLPNSTTFLHPWVATTVVLLRLAAKVGAEVDVRVLDARQGTPVAGATVSVGNASPQLTNAAGWTNFSNLRPPGLVEVVVSAPGYLTNSSWVRIDYYTVIRPYTVTLSPIPGCSGPACPARGASPEAPFGFLPSGGLAEYVVLGAPALLLAAALGYLAGSRFRREPDGDGAPRRRGAGGR